MERFSKDDVERSIPSPKGLSRFLIFKCFSRQVLSLQSPGKPGSMSSQLARLLLVRLRACACRGLSRGKTRPWSRLDAETPEEGRLLSSCGSADINPQWARVLPQGQGLGEGTDNACPPRMLVWEQRDHQKCTNDFKEQRRLGATQKGGHKRC